MVVSKLDILSQYQGLLINGNKKLQSIFGGLLSLLLFILCIGAGIFFGKELWEKKSPSVNMSKINDKLQQQTSYDFNNFNVMFRLVHNEKVLNNPRIYTMVARLTEHSFNNQTRKLEKKSNFLEMEMCTENSFSKENFKLFKNQDYKNSICLKKDQPLAKEGRLGVKGFFGTEGFKMMLFMFYQCKNRTKTSNDCDSQEEIDKFLNQATISIFQIGHLVRTEVYAKPIKKILLNSFYLITNKFRTNVDQYLRNLEIISDDSLLISSYSSYTSFQLGETVVFSLTGSLGDYDQRFFSYHFQMSNIKQIYNRKYTKIQDVLAQIGGIFKSINIILSIIYNKYQKNNLFDFLLNKSFNIQKIKNINNSEIISFRGNLPFHRSTKILQDKIQVAKPKDQLDKDSLSFFAKLGFIRNKPKKKLLELANKEFKRVISVESVLKLHYELKQLQYLILNKNQQKVLNKFNKPTFNPKNLKEEGTRNEVFEDYQKFLVTDLEPCNEEFEKALQEIISLDNPNEIDIKLVSLALSKS